LIFGMRPILVFAAIILALAAVAPRLLRSGVGSAMIASATPDASNPEPSAPRKASIPRGSNGHFETDVIVNGRRIPFMVDTGASVIALREQEASRLGFHPAPRDYAMKVSTANGVILAAPVALRSVELGGITVRDVAAVVLPDGALGQNLLGMSFLSRVRWQYQGGRLVLEQ
jgi:aspartyl protease family protein